MATPSITDCCVHFEWSSQLELMEYMPEGWREFLGRPGTIPGGRGMMPALPNQPLSNPAGDNLAESYPDNGGPAGSDYEFTRHHWLDRMQMDRAVLMFVSGQLAPAIPNHHLATEVTRAANDWAIDRWLSGPDRRLFGLVLAPNHSPEEAVKEIHRVGQRPQMVGVLMGANGLGKAFGHPIYHPIYKAAAELELPIVFHAGGDVPPNTTTHPTAAGIPALYAEYRALLAQSVQTAIASLITQGVFEKYPTLRVFLAGAGITWIPAFIWRLDDNYRGVGTHELPWMTRLPSEYFLEHVFVSTYPLDPLPDAHALNKTLSAFPGVERTLCFGSGYPNWDANDVDEASRKLPSEWHAAIFEENATKAFRWSAPTLGTARAGVAVKHDD